MFIYYVFRFLRLWAFFALLTILFSLLIMVTTSNVFEKNGKKSSLSFIPIYNLLIMLDIVGMTRWFFILLLIPFVNVFVIMLILYRLSVIFRTNSFFALGLIFFPFIFLPILNFSSIFVIDKVEENKDVSPEMVTLLTEEQYNELNNSEPVQETVDNVFKAPVTQNEDVPIFKANKTKYIEMVLPEEKKEEIRKIEPVIIEDIYTNRFINTKVTEEDDSIEIVEL